MDNIRNMFKSAYSGNAVEFEKDFDAVMTAKMNGAIEAKYDSMFGKPELEVEPQVETEVETTETED